MASILVVGPHPDDQELGMGGTVAKLAAQGHRVTLLDMTNGEPTPHGSVEIRAKEAEEAARLLSPRDGSNPVRRILLGGTGLPNRQVQHTLEARHMVAGVIRAVQAQIVFVPYPEDAHPDHRAVTRIVEDARFDAKLTKVSMPGDEGQPPIYPKWLFYYFATHLRIIREPSFLIDTTGFEEQKKAAILAYRSQFVVNRANMSVVDWVASLGVYMGSRIGTASAEAFWSPEPVGLSGLEGLV
jgi:bacillithiol biosynthesis deacetylase BshB1